MKKEQSKAHTVLIAEDEEAMRKILDNEFQRDGFSTILAQDGEEALQHALEDHPDVILLDILMPKMGGLEALKKIREDAWGKNIPVLLLTNLSDMDNISEAVHIGIAGYLVKSDWKLKDVISKTKEVLVKHKAGKPQKG